MKSPTEAIDSFWKDGFFTQKRKTSEVTKKLSDLGLNPGNTTDLLGKRKYLRNKNGYWFQKHPFVQKDEGIEIYHFEPGKPRTSKKNFVEILNQISGDVKICDPYFTKDSLDALEELSNAKVKFLTSNKKENIKVSNQELSDFKKEFSHVEIKRFPFDHLHDRYILTKDRLFILGHGFSTRNKETFIIEFPEKFAKDLIQSLNITFDTRWKHKNNVIF